MKNTYRKIVLGRGWNDCVYYVKGSKYTLGEKRCILTEMVDHDTEEGMVDIYVDRGDSVVIWKTIKLSESLDREYDINFD